MSGVVVVGGGMAGTRLAELLAARGAPVTLLTDEAHAPYNRILLSAVLEGTHDPALLALHPDGWYADAGIDLRRAARVADLDLDGRAVVLTSGERVPYEQLVLATGSIPTLPPVRGLVRVDGTLDPAVHAFRSLDDCQRLEAAVRRTPAGRAVVVGGGLLGLQVARALAVRGLAVEVVEAGEHLLRSQVGATAGGLLARELRRLGTEVYTGARAVRWSAGALVLDNGAELPTDLLVLAAGGRPSTGLARRAGLQVRRGVVVDDRLTTSDPAVHALGDYAEHEGAVSGLVPPAWEQAAVLADRLTGPAERPAEERATYRGHRPVARLRATGLDVAVLGDRDAATEPGSEVVEMTNPVAGSHRRIVVRGGRIVAATLVGDLSRVGLITGHYDRGTVLGPTEPGALLAVERASTTDRAPAGAMPDEVEVCTCAGVSAGAVRSCGSLTEVRETTHATTGCGGCADAVRALLASRPTSGTVQPRGGTPR